MNESDYFCGSRNCIVHDICIGGEMQNLEEIINTLEITVSDLRQQAHRGNVNALEEISAVYQAARIMRDIQDGKYVRKDK